MRIDPPEASTAYVGQARAELISKQPEQPKNNIAYTTGIRHYFSWPQTGLLFQKPLA